MKTVHDTFGAASCRADGLCVLRPAMPQGFMDAESLMRVAEVVRKYDLPGVRATGAQRLEIHGIPPELVDTVTEAVGSLDGKCPFMMTLCLGKGQCSRGLQDTRSMAAALENMLEAMADIAVRPKFGVSGCPRGCGQSWVRDIGLIGDAKGWTLLFGGAAGRKARPGEIIAKHLCDGDVLKYVKRTLDFFAGNAKKGERAAGFAERIGMEAVRQAAQNPEPE
jgi:NAD(P)H-nitrite reductase large subunit